MSLLASIEWLKGTIGKTSHDRATITTTWNILVPDDGNNIRTGGSVIVLEQDLKDYFV